VTINTSGGLTDGDEIQMFATWGPGTLAAVTSQTAERIYRARTDVPHVEPARIATTLSVAHGATGLWLPQETILFDGGHYRRQISADIAEAGTLLACESLIIGRRAMGERVTSGSVHDSWRVRYVGRLVLADALRLDGDMEALLDRPAIGRGGRAMATVILAGAASEACLNPAREIVDQIGAGAGVSRIGPVIIARLLATDGATLRKDLTAVLAGLLAAMGRANPAGLLALPRLWHF
jgi:urease accessory protein